MTTALQKIPAPAAIKDKSDDRWMAVEEIASRWAKEIDVPREIISDDLSDWYAAYCMRDQRTLTEMDQDQAMVQFLSLVGTPSVPKAAIAVYCQEHGLHRPAFWFGDDLPKMAKPSRHQDLSAETAADPAVKIAASCDKYFAASQGPDIQGDDAGASIAQQIAALLATDDLPVVPQVAPIARDFAEDATVAPLPEGLRKRWEQNSQQDLEQDQSPAVSQSGGHPFRRSQQLAAAMT